MKPNEQQLDRMTRLFYAFRDEVNPDLVDLDDWKCGTHACLGGHAAQMSQFQAEGFVLEERFNPRYNSYRRYEACAQFFGSRDCFQPSGCADMDDKFIETFGEEIGDHHLALLRMQEFLRENGITVELGEVDNGNS